MFSTYAEMLNHLKADTANQKTKIKKLEMLGHAIASKIQCPNYTLRISPKIDNGNRAWVLSFRVDLPLNFRGQTDLHLDIDVMIDAKGAAWVGVSGRSPSELTQILLDYSDNMWDHILAKLDDLQRSMATIYYVGTEVTYPIPEPVVPQPVSHPTVWSRLK